MSTPDPIVLLAGPGDSTNIVYNYLVSKFANVVAIVETPVPRVQLARRRAKRLGWATVAGQIAFVRLAMPLLKRVGQARIDEIMGETGFDASPIPDPRPVDSVNSAETIQLLRDLHPALIVVNGTRIISNTVLAAVECAFVNTHAGITPRYRGVHGGYWALRDHRKDLVGTTVHLVDPGIDTGGVLAQGTFDAGPRDSLATYPYLHLECGLPLLAECVRQILNGEVPPPVESLDDSGDSTLRWHPTLWGYLRGRLRDQVK